MTTAPCSGFLTHLRGIVFAREADSLSDPQLLDGFLVHRQEAAFAALVRRHGPMVLGVCRRVLGNFCDAEDAFQATFLVLARKAASLNRPEQVSNWLYGVAYRTSLKARARRTRRQVREEPLNGSNFAAARDATDPHHLLHLLDEELRRLPEKYRTPIVLCYLEGKTKEQAARVLRRPEGTISTQLARGREILRRRLTRRGAALSTAALM